MQPAPQTGAMDGQGEIAGRIEPGTDTLLEAIEAWAGYMRSRNKSVGSIRSMTSEIRRAGKALGWSRPSDLTFASVTGWLGSHDWAPTTHDRNLSIFKSFCRWLDAAEILPADPLRRAERAGGEGGPGTRAATTDEAKAIVRAAWVCEQTDGRARRSARALYWACLFLAGCRVSEPAEWLWSDLLLDEAVPCILWRPDAHKAGRRQETAMHPELAALLRRWREATGGAGEVFPASPSRNGFAADRDRASIPRLDARGRPLSAHSARKWAATTMTLAGVSPRIVDKLLRHAGGTEGRYVDAGLADQAEAIKTLPPIWPEVIGTQTFAGLVRKNPASGPQNLLTRGASVADDVTVKVSSMPNDTFTSSHPETRPADVGQGLDNQTAAVGRVSLCDDSGAAPPQKIRDAMGIVSLGNGDALNIAVADLLEAAARVVRESGRDAKR